MFQNVFQMNHLKLKVVVLMASYTMQLREYIEHWSQDDEYLSSRERIKNGQKKLFDFDYPIFDEDYRNVFETNFIRKFYMREIGFETEGLFKFQLESWLLINMPYFNKLFESELIKYNPLENSMTEKHHEKTNEKDQTDNREISQTSNTDGTSDATSNQKGKTTGESIDDNFNRDLTSDNPDARLGITAEKGTGIIEYARQIDESKEDNKRNTKSDTTNDAESHEENSVSSKADQSDMLNSNINEMEHFIEKRVGKIGVMTYPRMIEQYRQSLIRIENMIYKEMQELFMLVY